MVKGILQWINIKQEHKVKACPHNILFFKKRLDCEIGHCHFTWCSENKYMHKLYYIYIYRVMTPYLVFLWCTKQAGGKFVTFGEVGCLSFPVCKMQIISLLTGWRQENFLLPEYSKRKQSKAMAESQKLLTPRQF